MGRDYWITWILISTLTTFFLPPVGPIIILLSLIIIPAIVKHFNKKDYAEWIAAEAEQEINEIEAELDTILNDDKVTPIWDIPTKKK